MIYTFYKVTNWLENLNVLTIIIMTLLCKSVLMHFQLVGSSYFDGWLSTEEITHPEILAISHTSMRRPSVHRSQQALTFGFWEPF